MLETHKIRFHNNQLKVTHLDWKRESPKIGDNLITVKNRFITRDRSSHFEGGPDEASLLLVIVSTPYQWHNIFKDNGKEHE